VLRIIDQKELLSYSGSCSNLFTSPEWLSVISITYNIEFHAVVSEDKSFILPFCLISDEFYSSVKSIPFSDYTLNSCGDKQLNSALQLLREKYPDHYIETSVVDNHLPLVKGFSSNKYGYLIQINIQKWKESRDWKEAYERNIRNALNYGLAVKINKSLSGMEDFYKLHEQLRINKFNKLPQPIRFFTNIYHEFIKTGKGFLLEAWDKNKLIASWVILEHAKTLYYKFGASDINSLNLRPNDLLFRSLMQYGSDNGFKVIDLGFSGATKSYEGLIRFKSKEGGDKTPVYRIDTFPEDFDPSFVDNKSKYMQSIIKDALNTGLTTAIREASNKYYGKFA
jgi:hypothetical protein